MCWKLISVSGMFVYEVQQRLPFPEALEIFNEKLDGKFARVGQIIGGVRREQHVRHFPERMFGGERLAEENVEGGTAQFSVLQRVDQGRLVDDGAAADVDDDCGRLHARDS